MNKRVVRAYYGFQTFFGLLIWTPIFYEYQRRMGLSDPDIFGIQSYYYLAFCFLEVPTGFIADRFGYRRSMRFGASALLISNLIPIFFVSFGGFLLHWLVLALARSLISGAASAYLYEYMNAEGRPEQYKQMEGNARAISLVAKVVCWSGVGLMMSWHATLPYWATAACSLIALSFALSMPGFALRRKPVREGEGSAWLMPLRSPLLGGVILLGMGLFVLGRVAQVNLYQPILESKGFAVISYGWIMAAMTVIEAFGAARPNWIRRFMGDAAAVLSCTMLVCLSLVLLSVASQPGTIGGMFLFAYATGLAFPIQKQLMNDVIPDPRYRATILSFESIVDRGASAWAASMMGAFLGAGRLHEFLQVAAGVTVTFMVVVFVGVRLLQRGAARRRGELGIRVGNTSKFPSAALLSSDLFASPKNKRPEAATGYVAPRSETIGIQAAQVESLGEKNRSIKAKARISSD